MCKMDYEEVRHSCLTITSIVSDRQECLSSVFLASDKAPL
jgi:hypothetical protein